MHFYGSSLDMAKNIYFRGRVYVDKVQIVSGYFK